MLLTIFTGVSYFISVLLIWSGVSGIARPLHSASPLPFFSSLLFASLPPSCPSPSPTCSSHLTTTPAARTLFGVPNATQDTVTFYPGLAGRNVAAGLALLTLLMMGQTRAAGVVVTCLLCNGASDCYVLAMREGSEKMGIHVFNMCVGAVVGPGLLLLS
jgi:hypothetical protein